VRTRWFVAGFVAGQAVALVVGYASGRQRLHALWAVDGERAEWRRPVP
jgi:hypothetical protein